MALSPYTVSGRRLSLDPHTIRLMWMNFCVRLFLSRTDIAYQLKASNKTGNGGTKRAGSGCMAKPFVSDNLWAVIEPLLPPERPRPKGGRPPLPHRPDDVGRYPVCAEERLALGD